MTMAEKKYSIKHYDIVRDWEKDAEVKTGLTRKRLLKDLDKILDDCSAPKIEIQIWRDGT
jgi:hypothetical protein